MRNIISDHHADMDTYAQERAVAAGGGGEEEGGSRLKA